MYISFKIFPFLVSNKEKCTFQNPPHPTYTPSVGWKWFTRIRPHWSFGRGVAPGDCGINWRPSAVRFL